MEAKLKICNVILRVWRSSGWMKKRKDGKTWFFVL
jgi:hypothetical protein